MVVPFILKVPDPKYKLQIQTKAKNTVIQTIPIITKKIRTIDTIVVETSKTTDTTTIAIHQSNTKTETTRDNNHVDIVTEQIISPGIVKTVLTAEDWDICLANVESHKRIRTIGNKNQILTKTDEITIKTATQTPHSIQIP